MFMYEFRDVLAPLLAGSVNRGKEKTMQYWYYI